jgi:transcriptional regulator with XRE-family HTH domain
MEAAASEFLRALRGNRSQVQLARRLGYRGNPITDWERGERFPTAEETLRVASIVGVDVPAALQRFSASSVLVQQSRRLALAPWLDALRGTTTVTELAQRLGGSRFSVARWLNGTSKPRLPDFFRLVDAITGRLPEWVAELVSIERVPSLVPRFRAAASAKRLAFELPWTEAVLRILETSGYRQQRASRSTYISSCLDIPVPEVERCIQQLQIAGVIERRGAKYILKRQMVVDTQGGQQALHDLKRHWSQVAAERLRAPREADFFAYNLISVSSADLVRVREKLIAAFREIRSLVAASQPEESAALINLQVVSFLPGELAPPGHTR